jgi:telomere length regulation protein
LQSDKYEQISLGLKSAPDLIRRKATFGTELSDHAVNLSRVLVSMQDTFEMENFQELRQGALIAVVASTPKEVLPYFVHVYFTGDMSLQQRLILLSVLGLGAREIAGLEKPVSFSTSKEISTDHRKLLPRSYFLPHYTNNISPRWTNYPYNWKDI